MNHSKTKSKAIKKKNDNVEDVDTIVSKILARNRSISEATEHSVSNKKPQNQKVHGGAVFTKEEELALRNHITKCCQTQYGVTTTTIRKMIYEYAKKLPDCGYPEGWDKHKMACMDWFLKFRSRHPGLKKTLTKKFQHSCICIMGCHMGQEGQQALKKLEAKVLIARVYHYLHREYEYMKMCNDLSLLVNILRRTAEATGVCEQTITKILDEEKRSAMELNDIIPESSKKKRQKTTVMDEHNYNCNKESSQVEVVDDDSSSSNNALFSDFERLQRDATSIKSVMVEILDDDSEELFGKQNSEVETIKKDWTEGAPNESSDKPVAKHNKMRIIFADDEPNKPDTYATQDKAVITNSKASGPKKPACKDPPVFDDPASIDDDGDLVIDESKMMDDKLQVEDNKMRIVFPDDEPKKMDDKLQVEDNKMRIVFADDKPNKMDDKLQVEDNKMRLVFADDKPNKKDLRGDAGDTAMRIDTPDIKYSKSNSFAKQDETATSTPNGPVSTDPPHNEPAYDPASSECEGDLVIDESQINLDYNPDDRSEDTNHTKDEGIDEIISTNSQHGNQGDKIPSRKRHHSMDIYHGHMKIAVKNASSLSVDDRPPVVTTKLERDNEPDNPKNKENVPTSTKTSHMRLKIKDLLKHRSNIKEVMRWSNATPIRRVGDNGYVCCYCNDRYLEPEGLKKHTLENHNDVRKAFFIEHLSKVRFIVKLDITSLRCKICDQNIDSLDTFLKHLKIDHRKIVYTTVTKHIIPFKFATKTLQCCICTSYFDKFRMLLEHMNTHYTEEC